MAGGSCRGDLETGTMAHRVKKKRHAAAAIGPSAKRVIDFAGRDNGVRVRRAHPFHRGLNLAVRDAGTMANDHDEPLFYGEITGK